jgi:hypothetical protein
VDPASSRVDCRLSQSYRGVRPADRSTLSPWRATAGTNERFAVTERLAAQVDCERAAKHDRNEPLHRRAAALHDDAAALQDDIADRLDQKQLTVDELGSG